MPQLPAYCPRCQIVFPSPINVTNAKNITVRNSGTNCPRCGGYAELASGVFNATQDAIEVLSGPDSTRAIVEAFKGITERLKQGEISKDQAIKEAEEISPKYATVLAAFTGGGATALNMLISLLTIWLMIHLQEQGDKSSTEQAEKLLNAVTQQTYVLEEIKKQGAQTHSDKPTNLKSPKKAAAVEHKNNRRSQVRKERRDRLIERRKSFGGARTH
jgi:hypothetical protein